ncbi:protein kinase [Rhizoctonia solani]|uniref:Protein kinase n=1 Tax=Rhizoctonia solani TaxID=456999 RepID=A0A8H7H7U3_9AGAM|nr:protein kinase [Rhizoctonia solani]
MQNPRVLSLRIDTNVRPSLHLPSGSLQDTPWRTPVTPGSPALFSPTNTSASTQTPVTPASRAPWFPIGGNAGSPGSCDIDILKYPNVVHAGEPRDHGAFASIERLGGSLRGLLMSKPSQSKDSQLSKTTAMVIESNLSDWSVVEEVLKEALATATNTNCVLKGIIRKVKTGDAFQQLSAGRLWAALMKRSTSILYESITRKEFLADLEQVICSPRTELVAADRLIAVLATSIHDFPHQEGTERLKELWNKLCVQRTLDRTPIHPEDAIYGTVPLIDTVRGTSIENSTVPTPYYEPRVPPSSPHPENRPDGQVQTRDDSSTPCGNTTDSSPVKTGPLAKRPAMETPQLVVEDEDLGLPPPYSPSQVASTSSSRMLSVVDNYPFAKGYTNDIGPDIDIDSLEPHPFARGAFGDVRRGSLRDGTPVAIKCLRFYTQAQTTGRHKLEKKSLKEIRVWSFLNHENVLPLLGLCVVNNELGMVSEFMPNGTIQEYIRNNPGVDRYQLAIYVCAGLAYLHEHPKHVVHGDLKALNVVVDANGVPKLTDFGLAQMIRAEDSTERSSSSCVGGTSRWMAPELIGSESPSASCGKPNSASDVHALGMTIYEIFTGALPFSSLKREPQVILAIMNREIPERIPSIFTDELWDLLCQCWKYDAKERPTARQVLHVLEKLHSPEPDI